MEDKDVVAFINLLEEAGYEGAEILIRKMLIPYAKKNGLSLWEAVDNHADDGEDQDTSWYQLYEALTKISEESVDKLDIFEPL